MSSLTLTDVLTADLKSDMQQSLSENGVTWLAQQGTIDRTYSQCAAAHPEYPVA